MPDLVVTAEENITIFPGVNNEVIGVRPGRRSLSFQVQASGDVWCKFNSPTSPGNGFLVRGFELVHVEGFFRNDAIPGAYTGTLNIFWAGGYLQGATTPAVSCNCRVVEME